MVQLEPNLTLTLKHLGPHGAVITTEQQVSSQQERQPAGHVTCARDLQTDPWPLPSPPQAALDHSLPIKRTEAGLKSLTLSGKILATNGKVGLTATARTTGLAYTLEAGADIAHSPASPCRTISSLRATTVPCTRTAR